MVTIAARTVKTVTEFPQISGNKKSLDLRGSGAEEVPSAIQSLGKLERLDMEKCKLKSLYWLNLRGCCKLVGFPEILQKTNLQFLELSGTGIKELPSMENLNRLEELSLEMGLSL
ncbi:hypothetical protein Dsin_023350 [Dipteronia sinensis]|uniref:Uncharacterized protein n=1 Tax=Dipteronia sinensis TaxID=43782 RepID=A0AAE0A369_9ROSI|nr:hypothetical protein Dsin_023350 [Dipteronia sinensis]